MTAFFQTIVHPHKRKRQSEKGEEIERQRESCKQAHKVSFHFQLVSSDFLLYLLQFFLHFFMLMSSVHRHIMRLPIQCCFTILEHKDCSEMASDVLVCLMFYLRQCSSINKKKKKSCCIKCIFSNYLCSSF